MAIAFDIASNANTGAATAASVTWSHTTTGSNTLLVVGLTWTGNTTVMNTITHAGNNPSGSTGIYASTGTIYNSQIWWWINPTAGAQSIIATPSAVASIFGGGATFTGVDQTTPVLPLDRAGTIGNTFGGVSLGIHPSSQGAAMFNLIGMANATSTLAAVSPAVQAFNQFDATAARTGAGEYLLTTSDGKLNTLAWVISGTTARPYAMQSIAINPVGGTVVPFSKLNNSGLRPHLFSPGLAR